MPVPAALAALAGAGVALAVLAATLLALQLLWRGSGGGDELREPSLTRYRFAHEGFLRPLPAETVRVEWRPRVSLRTRRGVELRLHSMLPPRARFRRPRGVVVFLPSVWASAEGSLGVFFHVLAQGGFAAYAADYAGFGESAGERHWIESPGEPLRDALEVCEEVAALHRDAPLYVGGDGLGGAVALLCSVARPTLFSGLLLVAPGLEFACLSPWAERRLRLTARLAPRRRVAWPFELDMLSRNLCVPQQLATDPLWVRDGVPARTAVALLELAKLARGAVAEVSVPFHVQHGDCDLIFAPAWSRTLLNSSRRVPPDCKALLWYHGSFHALLLEAEAEEVGQAALAWLEERLKLEALARTLD